MLVPETVGFSIKDLLPFGMLTAIGGNHVYVGHGKTYQVNMVKPGFFYHVNWSKPLGFLNPAVAVDPQQERLGHRGPLQKPQARAVGSEK